MKPQHGACPWPAVGVLRNTCVVNRRCARFLSDTRNSVTSSASTASSPRGGVPRVVNAVIIHGISVCLTMPVYYTHVFAHVARQTDTDTPLSRYPKNCRRAANARPAASSCRSGAPANATAAYVAYRAGVVTRCVSNVHSGPAAAAAAPTQLTLSS